MLLFGKVLGKNNNKNSDKYFPPQIIEKFEKFCIALKMKIHFPLRLV